MYSKHSVWWPAPNIRDFPKNKKHMDFSFLFFFVLLLNTKVYVRNIHHGKCHVLLGQSSLNRKLTVVYELRIKHELNRLYLWKCINEIDPRAHYTYVLHRATIVIVCHSLKMNDVCSTFRSLLPYPKKKPRKRKEKRLWCMKVIW